MKKVLITGGNGFLGSNVARELYRSGFDVRIMMRAGSASTFNDIPCEVFYGDIKNPIDVQNAVYGCDAVVHTASVTKQWAVTKKEYEETNINGTKNIVHACIQHKVKKLIHVSTANTIGPGNKVNPATELSAFQFMKAHSHYINTKYIAEQYVLEQAFKNKLPAVIVNPTFMLGENDSKPSSGQIVLYGINKRIVWVPPGGKNFVHIKDVCRGIINSLDYGITGECYLLASENLSYKEFFKLLSTISDQQPILITIPGFILKAGGFIGEVIGFFRKKSVKLNYASSFMLCIHNYYSGKKAEKELHITYTPVKSAIVNALNWFKENNYC